MDRTEVACARHPDTQTRLRCSQCGTAICPRCLVDAHVGQKCPDCARLPKAVRRQGKPQQYAKAVLVGVGAAAVGAYVLSLVYGQVRFFTWILSGVAGYFLAKAVLFGAEGNRAVPFRNLAFGAAVLACVGGWLLAGAPPEFLVRHITPIGTYLAAIYGAYLVFR